ncbi:putative sucrose-phosphatase 2 [Zea mays]|uniref:Putative sucrose-phosphatase 2 n=1 Tax=Zea mays TaxID=4577 RepID=A0A1D6LFY5_MAIZE|nr:putative sucrose-phosphatase 2 [Zea mays]
MLPTSPPPIAHQPSPTSPHYLTPWMVATVPAPVPHTHQAGLADPAAANAAPSPDVSAARPPTHFRPPPAPPFARPPATSAPSATSARFSRHRPDLRAIRNRRASYPFSTAHSVWNNLRVGSLLPSPSPFPTTRFGDGELRAGATAGRFCCWCGGGGAARVVRRRLHGGGARAEFDWLALYCNLTRGDGPDGNNGKLVLEELLSCAATQFCFPQILRPQSLPR